MPCTSICTPSIQRPGCSRIDIWHGIYNHALATPQAIVEWFKGSSLQPFLSALDGAAHERFLAAYSEEIAQAYKPRFDGKYGVDRTPYEAFSAFMEKNGYPSAYWQPVGDGR